MHTYELALLTNGCCTVLQFVVFSIILSTENKAFVLDAYIAIYISLFFGYIFFIDGILARDIFQVWSYSVFLVYQMVAVSMLGFKSSMFVTIFFTLAWYFLLILNLIVDFVFFRLLFYEFAWYAYRLTGADRVTNGKFIVLI